MSTTGMPGRDFNTAVNGHRGVCAMLVFLFHMGASGILAWPSGSTLADAAYLLWSSCAFGVEMFFMISGFVILGSLLRHASIGAFLRDRFARIFSAWVPALIAVTLVCLVFQLKIFADITALQALGLFIANLLLLPPVLPLPLIHLGSWSLTYEWVFYLTAALGMLLLRRGLQRRWAVAAWVMLAATFITLFPRSLFFITGILVFTQRAWFERHRRWLKFPLLSLLLFLLCWRLTDIYEAGLSQTLLDFLRDGRWVPALLAFAASIHLFASICVRADWQSAFLESRVCQFLGTISYSFYLWHVLVMGVVKRIVVPPVQAELGAGAAFAVFSLLSLALALPVSWASWQLFEVKLATRMKQAMTRRPALRNAEVVHVR